ncbi:MAG TPA: hypothetical protein VIO33_06370 [Burkholderiaceae bacterium]
MTTFGWLLVTTGTALFSAALGAGSAMRRATQRARAAAGRAFAELEQRHAAALEQLRTLQTRAQAELEQARSQFKRQLLAASSEPSVQLAHAEERLRIAYAELDRLRAQLNSAETAAHAELTDGFAATQPMPTSRY